MTQSRRLRVAHVVLSLEPGGTEKLVIDLAAEGASRFDVFVFCLDRAGEWASRLGRIPVAVIGRAPGFDLGVVKRLWGALRAQEIDVLHCHQYTPFVYGVLAARLRPRTRVVYTEHGRVSDAAPSAKRRRINRWVQHLPDVITAVSCELRGFMAEEGFDPARVQVVVNGIAPGPAPTVTARDAARHALGMQPGDFVIGMAGRLDPVKNVEMAIEVQRRLEGQVPAAMLAVVGDGPARTDLERRASAAGIRASFVGYRTDVRTLMNGFDVSLNTSHSEGISVTLLESMAAAVPVVATAVGGTPEIVANERTGLLVPKGDVDGCVRALARLAADSPRRDTLGAAGRQRVIDEFSLDRMFSSYASAYAREAGARRQGRR